jgi:hypothetical protein
MRYRLPNCGERKLSQYWWRELGGADLKSLGSPLVRRFDQIMPRVCHGIRRLSPPGFAYDQD